MNKNQLVVLILLGLAAGGALYFAVSNTPNTQIIPQFEAQGTAMGMNVNAGLNLGKLMDTSHLWDPIGNPRDHNPPCGVIATPHRYPALPGGNVSTVLHKGWGAMTELAPAGNDWFLNPPTVAVL